MPTPEQSTREGAGPIAAVRAVLDALAVPAARQALLLEQALAAQMAVFTGAPAAATFDPLSRPAGQATAFGVTPSQSGAARRKAASSKPGAAGAEGLLGGVGAVAAAALQAATEPPPAQSILTGIAAAVAALTAPDRAASRRPPVPPTESAARTAALGTLGAVAQTAHAAAAALEVVPIAGATAPVLERIAQIGGALWLQVALSPPGQATSSNTTADNGGARSARSVPGVAGRAATGSGARSNSRPDTHTHTASPGATSPVETVSGALAGIGRLTVELFGAAVRAGSPDLFGTPARPAPRAPNVLAPERAPEPTSRPSGGAPSPAAPGVTVDVDTDVLARALRAEAELRGLAL